MNTKYFQPWFPLKQSSSATKIFESSDPTSTSTLTPRWWFFLLWCSQKLLIFAIIFKILIFNSLVMIFAVMFLKTFTLAKILNFYFRNNFQNFFLQLFSGVFLLRFSGNLYFCKKFKTFPLAIIFKISIFNYSVMIFAAMFPKTFTFEKKSKLLLSQ